jgi:hypothetical protein
LASGVGTLLKQFPVGRNIKETIQMSLAPPEFGPEGKALSRELNAWDRTGKEIGAVYHGGKTTVGEVDPSKLQQRDAGFYGPGFYVTKNEQYAKTYGSKVSQKTFNPDAKILDVGTIHPGYEQKVNPELQKEIEATQRAYLAGLPKAQKNPNLVNDYLELIDPKSKSFDLHSWVEAVNRHAEQKGYDAIRFSDGEIVVKNPKALATDLSGLRTRPVQKPSANPKDLPAQPRLPDTGTHAAIKTDDGGIYPDLNPEKQRTHIMLAQDLEIPPERVVSGGWLKDGEYEGSERSDAGRWGEQARAKAAVAEKRTARSSESEQPPKSIPYSESESARAYHGTSVDAIPSIRKSGITTDKKYGNVWAADTVPEAQRYGLMGVQDYKWDTDTQTRKYNPNAEYAVAVVRVKGSGLKETDGVWKGTEHVPPENIERFDIYNSDGKLVRQEPGVAKQTERTPAATETLYHGSPDVSKIDSLKPGSAGGFFGNGVYLTRDPSVARHFTKLESANPTLERNADGSFTDINTGKRVPGGKPGVLSVTLKDAYLKSMTIEEMEAEVEKFRKPNGVINLDAARNAVAEKYAKQGYDGFDVPASKNFDEPQVLIFPSSAEKLSSAKTTEIDLSGLRVRPVTKESAGSGNLLRFTASDCRIYQVPKNNKAAVLKADPGAKFE